MSVQIADQQEFIPRAKAACRRAVEEVLGNRKVVVALVDDKTIAEVHGRFLDDPTPTDVTSFPHGEIVVSAETAAREARSRGIAPLDELLLYVIHGSLHLKGHDDRSAKASAQMRAAERQVLKKLGLGDVFGVSGPKPASDRRNPRRTRRTGAAGGSRKKTSGRRTKPGRRD